MGCMVTVLYTVRVGRGVVGLGVGLGEVGRDGDADPDGVGEVTGPAATVTTCDAGVAPGAGVQEYVTGVSPVLSCKVNA
ncbi:hypothetical protein TBS_27340 [Thermobispora bispora]